jgi:hypothetical protein
VQFLFTFWICCWCWIHIGIGLFHRSGIGGSSAALESMYS